MEVSWRFCQTSHTFLHKNWHLILLAIGVFSFNLDPVFLFLQKDCGSTSICMDVKLGACLAILRSLETLCFLCGKYFKGNRSSHESNIFREKYDFQKHSNMTYILDLAATIPLPEIVIWHGILTSNTTAMFSTQPIVLVVYVQFSFRIILMFHLTKKLFNMIGNSMRNPWTGALLNLIYFMIISNIWGALYYDMYVTKLVVCKLLLLQMETNNSSRDWDGLISACIQLDDEFKIGMFSEAISTKLATRSFVEKYVYCLSWGLKSLSSFGQTFSASSEPVDTVLSFFTVVFGLILFGDLLARMQSGLQTTEVRESAQRKRQRMMEEWMKYHQLPQGLKKQVKQAVQSEWTATKGLNDGAILESFQWDVRCEVRRHLYLDIVQTLPPFAGMDKQLVHAICGHLKTFSGKAGSHITFEGEPVRQMSFIYSGQLEVASAKDGGGGCSVNLGPGGLFGQQLLEWISHPTRATEDLPCSAQTIKCITDVDVFYLTADDVKLLAIQFHRDGKFRRAFQPYAL